MEYHPVADIFPLMGEKEFQDLVADIRQHGLRQPITTHEGKIIDGRNRFRACQLIGLPPRTEEWDGQGSLVAFVVSLNLKRRMLDESQRAMVAARIETFKQGRPSQQEKEQNSALSVTRDEAAALLNVSMSTPPVGSSGRSAVPSASTTCHTF